MIRDCLYPFLSLEKSLHGDEMIVIAISDKPVGLDIERIRKADFRIAKRFFSEMENKYINESTSKQNERFFEIWTKKEAYAKYNGSGLLKCLSSLDVIENRKIYKTLKIKGHIISICSKNYMSSSTRKTGGFPL